MSTHYNNVAQAVSGTPGTGTITLGSAVTGSQTIGAAAGGNATVDVFITDGSAWEVARNCTYTHSGTTLTRGTLEASSTGTALSLTSSAVVRVAASADSGRRWDAAALEQSDVTGTSGAITAAVNTLYVADMSGWTADRTLTLPATAAVGDRVGVMVSVGDDAYEWLVTAASGDTLNGVSGGTEWSRVFITGETVVFRCVTANSTWMVEYDGRIPQAARMSLTSSDITTSATGWLGLDLNTKELERGCIVTVAGTGVSTVEWRRASFVQIAGSWSSKAAATCTDNEQLGWGCSYGGAPGVGTIMFLTTPNHAGTTCKPIPGAGLSMQSVPAGSAIQISMYSFSTADLGARALAYSTYLSLTEVLS